MSNFAKSFFLILTIFLASCGVPQEDYDKVRSENKSLKKQVISLNDELDEFRFGEERLIALVEKNYIGQLFKG